MKKDSKGRKLRCGEDQMPDKRYRFRYTDRCGRRSAVYSWKLVPVDKIPQGKREDISLREKEEKIKQDLREGLDIKAAGRMNLDDLFQIFIDGKSELKETTYLHYIYMYQKYVSKKIGMRKINEIKFSDIKDFYNRLIYENNLGINSVGIIHTIIHSMFNLAIRDCYIKSNPSDGVLHEIKKKGGYLKEKRYALTVDEQEAFISYVSGSDVYRHWLPIFTVLLGTGLRAGELVGLRWSDCDFDNNIIEINHIVVYKKQRNGRCEMHISTPKSQAGIRIIPMLAEVKAALQSITRNRNEKITIDGYEDFIFLNKFGNVYNPETINRAIKRIYMEYNEREIENAGIENRNPLLIRHFSMHNLRHTFCTRLCENEINIKVIQEVMGHSDISITMNVYAEVTEKKKKEVFNNLEGKMKIA